MREKLETLSRILGWCTILGIALVLVYGFFLIPWLALRIELRRTPKA